MDFEITKLVDGTKGVRGMMSQKYAGNRRGVGALLLTHQVWGVLFVFAEVFNELSIRKHDEMYGC